MDEFSNKEEALEEAKTTEKAFAGEMPAKENGLPENAPSEKKEEKEKKTYTIKRGISPSVLIFSLICAVLITFMGTFLIVSGTFQKRFNNYKLSYDSSGSEAMNNLERKLSAMDSVIRENYLYDIDEDTLEDSVLKGYMYGIGDKYAEYYNKEELEALEEDSDAQMQGIGISVVFDEETSYIKVISVFANSPAEEAGIQTDDLVSYVKIDDEYTSVASLGYTVAMHYLRGAAGTTADFLVFRDGDYSNPIEFSVKREYVTEYTVTYKVSETDSSIGIISITSFDSKTPEQFKDALDTLLAEGVEKLIFDVRYNPGGELDSVASVLDMLLPEGPIVRTVDKDGNEETVKTSDAEEVNLPMAVLANGSTASAGELFTCALMDYDKAIFVGVKTYGKGSMQTTRVFADGTAFKYTYRYYCPPYSDNYDGKGIQPDVTVQLSEEAQKKNFYTLTEAEDNQLLRAIELLSE